MEVSSAADKVTKLNKKYEEALGVYRQIEKETDAEYFKSRREVENIAECSRVFRNTLEKTYADLLDLRDWQYIDYLIYMLETRRAENLKEALQLTDREIQTQRIVETLKTATQAICNTIQTNLGQIKQSMEKQFTLLRNNLNKKMDEIKSEISNMGAEINSNLSAIRANQNIQMAYLADISSQEHMSNAIAQKSAKTSQELLTSCNEFRNEYKMRNPL